MWKNSLKRLYHAASFLDHSRHSLYSRLSCLTLVKISKQSAVFLRPLLHCTYCTSTCSSGNALSWVNFTISSRSSVWMTAGSSDTSGWLEPSSRTLVSLSSWISQRDTAWKVQYFQLYSHHFRCFIRATCRCARCSFPAAWCKNACHRAIYIDFE